jgi:hypothetical protein
MSLAHYYSRAKGGLMNIDSKEAVQLGEDLLIAGGTGLVLGAISASIGGLDHHVAGMPVPVDGLASMGLALAGLSMRSPELKVASIAAGGSAATRTFEALFKRSLGAHGDFDGNDIPFGYGMEPRSLNSGGSSQQYGYGSDSLSRAAEIL